MKYIITESQRQTLLMETLSPTIRRRLSFENMKDEMDSIIEHDLNPCDFDNAGTFIEDACDMFVYIYLEDLQASAKDKDSLYYYAVDVFGKYLVDVYNERCGGKDGLNESVGDLSRKAKILKRYTEDMLSEKPWFNGLDITTSPYQTSHKDENGRRYLTTIPILTFKINTKVFLEVFHIMMSLNLKMRFRTLLFRYLLLCFLMMMKMTTWMRFGIQNLIFTYEIYYNRIKIRHAHDGVYGPCACR